MGPIKSKMSYQVWFLILLCYQVYIKFVYYLHLTLKLMKRTLISEKNELVTFVETIKTLPKVPSHIAVAFQYTAPVTHEDIVNYVGNGMTGNSDNLVGDNVLDLYRVANVASWLSMAPNVAVISLYDYYGILKLRQAELKPLIEKRIIYLRSQLQANEKLAAFTDDTVKVVLHAMGASQKCCENLNDYKGNDSQPSVHIFLFSRNDGKPSILKVVGNLYDEKKTTIRKNENFVDVSVVSSKLDFMSSHFITSSSKDSIKLSSVIKAEPDLLISLGEIRSTLDFLPWHIKFTELHWLPQVNHLMPTELLESFLKFAKCEQRFGK